MFEIIAIGNEILSGTTINTNATYLSKRLRELGYEVARHTVLPDEKDILKYEIKEALKRSRLVITTGGLGSTFDDVTKHVASEIFHSPLTYSEEVASDLKKRFGDHPWISMQATIPTKAKVLSNPLGTAPSFVFFKDKPQLILLPGIPREMEAFFERDVKALLEEHFEKKWHTQMIYLCLKSETEIEPFLLMLQKKYPSVEFGVYVTYGTVGIGLFAKDPAHLIPPAQEIHEEYKTFIFPSHLGLIEEAVHEAFIAKKKTLILAESCTGGKIAARITAFPGASAYFLGSLVTYCDELKRDVLHVSEEKLHTYGAVSAEIAKEMLQGALKLSQADFGIAITGIAGPTGGSKEKPVGTVWMALGEKDKEIDVKRIPTKIQIRPLIIEYAATFALASLWRKIVHG